MKGGKFTHNLITIIYIIISVKGKGDETSICFFNNTVMCIFPFYMQGNRLRSES